MYCKGVMSYRESLERTRYMSGYGDVEPLPPPVPPMKNLMKKDYTAAESIRIIERILSGDEYPLSTIHRKD